jgi:hypothetical protein
VIPSQPIAFPFAAGLLTKGNKQAKQPPALDIAKDVEFDDIGGLRTRYPYSNLSVDIYGGGTLSECRKFVENSGELLCFTKDALYSWSPALLAWVRKGTHLAVKVEEASRFVSPAEQIDCERCELDDTVVYAWTDNSQVWVAAVDVDTGTVTCAPTLLSTGGNQHRWPRLVALDSKILLIAMNKTTARLNAMSITPATVSTSIAGGWTAVGHATPNSSFFPDVCRVWGSDAVIVVQTLIPNTSYHVFTLTSALVTSASSTKARTSIGSVGVAVTPDGVSAQIIRSTSSTTVVGDLLTVSSLADVYTSTAVGAADNNANAIAIEYLPNAVAGVYTACVWWSSNEDSTPSAISIWKTRYTTIDTANAVGHAPANTFAYRFAPRSRAFARDGHVYVWMSFFQGTSFIFGGSPAFQAALQNTYFLYRDDGLLCGKALATEAGTDGWGSRDMWLPTVQDLTAGRFAFAGVERRVVPLGNTGKGYAARSPREVIVTFDSNEARRAVRLGKTLYIACGEGLMAYDGSQLVETGYHVFPYYAGVSTAAGSLPNGTYSYKPTYRWDNAQGEVDRSTTAAIGNIVLAAGPNKVSLEFTAPAFATHKTVNEGAVEFWRTVVNPTEDAPYYLVTSPDPSNSTNPNRYIANSYSANWVSTVDDNYTDATLIGLQSNNENGSVLENVAPIACSILTATQDRIFLAGLANRPDEVRYSKQRGDGEVASFNEALSVTVPHEGGGITALAILAGTLIVFREHCVYELPGDGFDNAAGGSNYGPARLLSGEVGAESHEAVVQVPDGLLFKSSKGWYVLSRAGSVQYVGASVAAYDSEAVLAAHVMPAQHQVRILTGSRMLVWDYLVNQWGEWTIANGLDACLWNDQHFYLTSSSVKYQRTDYADIDYGFDVETTWIKTGGDLQGNTILRTIQVLGELRGAFDVRVRLARNYQSDGAGGWSYFQDKTWAVTPTVVGGPLQLKFAPSIKRPIEAIKVRLTALAVGGVGAPTDDTCKLTGLSLAVADEGGLYSGLAAGQKQ